jgi:hypothetical protein
MGRGPKSGKRTVRKTGRTVESTDSTDIVLPGRGFSNLLLVILVVGLLAVSLLVTNSVITGFSVLLNETANMSTNETQGDGDAQAVPEFDIPQNYTLEWEEGVAAVKTEKLAFSQHEDAMILGRWLDTGADYEIHVNNKSGYSVQGYPRLFTTDSSGGFEHSWYTGNATLGEYIITTAPLSGLSGSIAWTIWVDREGAPAPEPAMAEASAVEISGPAVSTDKQSYYQQENVVIQGTGFTQDTDVSIDIRDPIGYSAPGYPRTITTDSSGWFELEWDTGAVCMGTYEVEVSGGGSAETAFYVTGTSARSLGIAKADIRKRDGHVLLKDVTPELIDVDDFAVINQQKLLHLEFAENLTNNTRLSFYLWSNDYNVFSAYEEATSNMLATRNISKSHSNDYDNVSLGIGDMAGRNMVDVYFEQTIKYDYAGAIVEKDEGCSPFYNDTQPPTIQVLSLYFGQTFMLNDLLNITLYVTDDYGIRRVYASILYPDGSTAILDLERMGDYYHTGFNDTGTPGLYHLNLSAVDFANNTFNLGNMSFYIQPYDLLNIYNESAEMREYKQQIMGANDQYVNLSIDFYNHTLIHLDIYNLLLVGHTQEARVGRASGEAGFLQAYSMDPSNLTFGWANLRVTAKGNLLYKCVEFDFTEQRCIDRIYYKQIRDDLVPDQEYFVYLNSTDPGFGELSSTVYYLFESTDPQYPAYRQLLTQAVGPTSYSSGAMDVSSPGVQCWTEEFIAQNWTQRTAVNGTWNFTVYGSCTHAGPEAYLFSRLIKVNSSGEYNFENTTQASTDLCTGGTTINTISHVVPYGSYTDLQPGERIGLSYCLNVTVGKNGKSAYVYWEGSGPSSVDFPSWTWDDVPPNVTLLAPANDTYSEDRNITFLYNVSDQNGIAACSLMINGTLNQTDTTVVKDTEQNFTVDYFGVGDYEWYVNCTDSVFNEGQSDTRVFKVIYPAVPPIWIDNRTYPPSPAVYNASQQYQFNVTWTDNAKIDVVLIEHNFTGTLANYTVTTNNSDEYYYDYPALAAGTYVWREYGFDNISQSNQTDQWYYVVQKDSSAVNLLLNGVDDNITIFTGQTVNKTGYKLAGPAYIYLYENGTLINSGDGPLENVTLYTVPGDYNITVAYLETQNYSASYETHFISVLADYQNPNVTNVTALPSSVQLGDSVNITADVTDDGIIDTVLARVSYPNSSVFDYGMINDGGDTYYYLFTTDVSYPLGQYNVTIIANDTGANVNNTETTYFNIGDSYPEINYHDATPDPVVAGNVTRIYANVTDNSGVDTVTVHVSGTNYTAVRNITAFERMLNVTDSTGDCTFAWSSTAEQANSSDDNRSLIGKATTCGWNVQDLNGFRFDGFNNITVYVEHVGETGITASSSTLYVGNATSTTEYGSSVLSTFEGTENQLELVQGVAVAAEGTDSYVTASVPSSTPEFDNLQVRVFNNDAGGEDHRGVDHIYIVVNFNVTSDVYYADVDTTGFTAGQNNYTVYANDTLGQEVHANGSFVVQYTFPPNWTGNNTYPQSPVVYDPGQEYQFNVTWQDEVSVSAVWIEHNFTGVLANYTVSTSSGDEYYYNYTALAAGNYVWREYGFDDLNYSNQTDQWYYVVTKDNSSVDLLLNGVDGNIMIYEGQTVNKTGYLVDGEGYIYMYQNGTLINSGAGPLENVTQYNIPGSYNITLVYYTTQNYTASSETHLITVNDDVYAPNVTNVAATPAVIGLGGSTNITADVTDDGVIDTVLAEVMLPNSTMFYYEMISGGGNTYYYELGTLLTWQLGEYNVTIIANDTSGKVNNTEYTNFTTYDDPPVFHFYDAVPDPVAVNYTIRIYANVSDNTAIDTVTVFVNGSNYSAVRNSTPVQQVIELSNSTSDCIFAHSSTSDQANSSDNNRSLIESGDTCGWNVGLLNDSLFAGFRNITVYVEHVAETGVTPSSSVLYVGNATSTSEYGSTTLSTNEGDQNQLEDYQGQAVTGEGTDNYLASSLPGTPEEFNNMQVRVYNGDAGGSDHRAIDHIYLLVDYDQYTDVYYLDINATWYPLGINNYTIYANDTIGQTSKVNGTFKVDYQVKPLVNITSPANGSSFLQGDDINFTGMAWDFEDGNLTKGSLVWDSDKDGIMGTGNLVEMATLTPGNHTITLTATDSFGLFSSESIEVEITSLDCPGMEAGWFTLADITIDGYMTDWDAVLQNPNNQITDGVSGVTDPDIVKSADKDLRKYAVTWNSEWLWMYVRRASGGTNIIGIDTYFDYDQDSLLEDTDEVLITNWAGSNRQYSTTLYNYTPVNASGDPVTGDGVDEPGTVSAPRFLESGVVGGSEEGIELEWRVRWSDLGLQACTPLIAHVSSTHGEGKNIPSQIEDNMASFDSRIYGIKFYADSIKSGKQCTTVRHTHTLRNIGNLPDIFNLDITGTRPGYNVTVSFANGTALTDTDGDSRIDTGYILPSYGVTLNVDVSIPCSAISGEIDVTTVTAFSNLSNTTNASVVDTTIAGAIAVIPNNIGYAIKDTVIEYVHYVYNNDVSTTVNVNATSSQGYMVTLHYSNGTELTDTNNDSIADLGVILEETYAQLRLRIYIPASATIGTLDNTTIVANSTLGEVGRAWDATEVSTHLSIIPNISRAGGQGTSIFMLHEITYVSNVSGVVDVMFNDTQNFTIQLFHDDYVTPLTDTDGSSIVDAGTFGTNGDRKTIVVKVQIPAPTPINTSELIYYTVESNTSNYTSQALDNVSVQKLVTYLDSPHNIQSYYFKQTEMVYSEAYALDMQYVYFQYIDPNSTVVRLSPYIPVDALDQAQDDYYVNSTDLSGEWTLVLYDRSGDLEITRIHYWVNTPPVVLNASDYPDPAYQGDIVNFTADITAGELNWFPNETVVLGALLEIDGINYSMTGPNTTSGIGEYYFDGLNTSNITPGIKQYRVFGYDNFSFYNVSVPFIGQIWIKAVNFTNVSGVITDSRYNIVNSTIYVYNSTGDVVVTDDEIYNFTLDRTETYSITIIPDNGSLKELTFTGVQFPPLLFNFTRLEDAQEFETDKPEEIYNWTEAIAWWTHPIFYYTQTRINFTYGTDTDLYFWKCSDWNFDDRNCTDNNFFVIQNLSDGPNWAVVYLSPGDPGAGAGRAPDYNETLRVWDVTGLNETQRRDNGTLVGEFLDLEQVNLTVGKAYRFEVFVTQTSEKAKGILRDPYYDNIQDEWVIDVSGSDAANITQINGSVVIHPFWLTVVSGTEAGTQKLIWDSAPPNKTVSDINANDTVKLWFVVDIPANATNETHEGHFLGKSKGHDAEITNNLTTITGLPPYKVNLTYPNNGNDTLINRTFTFIWEPAYDPDNQTLVYDINITSQYCSDISDTNVPATNYTPIYELGTYDECGTYNWTVRAFDGTYYGNWSDSWNFSIQPYIALFFINDTVDFGDADNDDTNDTTDNNPLPFLIQSDGNKLTDVANVTANQSFFTSSTTVDSDFQLKVDNSAEAGAFNWTGSATSWINLTTIQTIIDYLDWHDVNDSAEIDVKVHVPIDEPPGLKVTGLVFYGEQS